MSNSPCPQAPQGTGSGRRTTPTTRSPALKLEPGGAVRTRPSDSWPMTSRSCPGGAQPYSPRAISLSVPQTPTATASTSSSPWPGSGSGTSVTASEPACSGVIVSARMGQEYPAAPTATRPPTARGGGSDGDRVRGRLRGVVGEPVGAHGVVPGLEYVADDQPGEVELGGGPNQDREPVEVVALAAGGRGGPAAEIEPDGAVVEHLSRGEHEDVSPARPGQHDQGQQPQDVLRGVHLVDHQEPDDDEVGQLRDAW